MQWACARGSRRETERRGNLLGGGDTPACGGPREREINFLSTVQSGRYRANLSLETCATGNHLLPHCLVRLLEGWVVSVGNARILATLVLGCPLVFPHLPHLPLLPIVLVLPHHVLHSESGNHLNILNSRSQNAITLSQDSVVVFCDISPLPDELWVSLVLLRRTGHDLCFFVIVTFSVGSRSEDTWK